ncbi:uncharacterized protein Dvir_GJ25949 [Drosophila virilis]|uniref:Uncharacterized protein n=1 Tax=Drosophila virilis TaxID=7244 RepID=A0A0Q9W1V1_DROVI|nr:uncharacterized protein Dvir_GJ25949 [Drosophila virilis]
MLLPLLRQLQQLCSLSIIKNLAVLELVQQILARQQFPPAAEFSLVILITTTTTTIC